MDVAEVTTEDQRSCRANTLLMIPPFIKSDRLIAVFLMALIISCENRTTSNSELASASSQIALRVDFDWMIGNWIRTNEQENKMTFETWRKKDRSRYVGFGYTMQDNDTIWQESVDLVETDGNWSFDVRAKGENQPTRFGLTEIAERKFVCENKANEFPKRIEYWKSGEELHARISGGDAEALFIFKKEVQK